MPCEMLTENKAVGRRRRNREEEEGNVGVTNTLQPSARIGSCKVKQQGYCSIYVCIYR